MELSGEELIQQPVQKVWDALNDPQVLKACIPGCEEIVSVADKEYKVVLTAAVGPVKARFNGKLLLLDVHAPTSYSMTFEGAGGAAGFAKGSAKVALAQEGAGTRLAYSASANVGGKIAQVGSRLIDGVARKIATEFFSRFTEIIAAAHPDESLAGASTQTHVDQPAVHGSTESKKGGADIRARDRGKAIAWSIAAVIAAVMIAVYFW